MFLNIVRRATAWVQMLMPPCDSMVRRFVEYPVTVAIIWGLHCQHPDRVVGVRRLPKAKAATDRL